MSDNGNRLDRVESKISRMEDVIRTVYIKLEEMDRKLDSIMNDYEDEEPLPDNVPAKAPLRTFGGDDVKQEEDDFDEFISDDMIKTKGQKIPYNKIDDREQVRQFREFISYVRMNERKFTQQEIDAATFADKSFSDVHISDNSRRILGAAYQKAYGKPWKMTFIRGHMYKYQGQITWEWKDGTK